MQFSQYQKESRRTALYPNQDNNYIYPTLGLAGESGEVSEKIKKVIRDKKGVVNNEDRLAIEKELGDVLWYLSQLATELDIDLENVAKKNIDKLQSRLKRGTLSGSGDDR
ncbi:MAG: nucleoside triphosphate pyrophosphohydrolase family protein [Candidatus Delongbacteria bacterium]|jgi:NTP pyrophosphatase (non-canonical NTP hydrolase)|nr:nucleoside triphosphate pyrophosphohydrolase family protein [Candidatus Delongbacteria bacterium]